MRTSANHRFLTATICGLAFGLAVPATAAAEGEATSGTRITAVPMDRYEAATEIVRHRGPGRDHIKFEAMPAPIDEGAMVVFEVASISAEGRTPRWRCVARRNVRECFSRPLRLAYHDGDQQMVMSVRIAAAELLDAAAIARR